MRTSVWEEILFESSPGEKVDEQNRSHFGAVLDSFWWWFVTLIRSITGPLFGDGSIVTRDKLHSARNEPNHRTNESKFVMMEALAIANYFDLELKQYDVPTVFLNSKINRRLYPERPEEFSQT